MEVKPDIYLDAYSLNKRDSIQKEIDGDDQEQFAVLKSFDDYISIIRSQTIEILHNSLEITQNKNVEFFEQLLIKADSQFMEEPSKTKSIVETLAYEMNNTATKLMSRKRFELALRLLKKCKFFIENDFHNADIKWLLTTLNNLGYCLTRLNKHNPTLLQLDGGEDSAKKYQTSCKSQMEQHNIKEGYANNLLNLSTQYSILKDHNSGLDYAKKASVEFKSAALEIEQKLKSDSAENEECEGDNEKRLNYQKLLAQSYYKCAGEEMAMGNMKNACYDFKNSLNVLKKFFGTDCQMYKKYSEEYDNLLGNSEPKNKTNSIVETLSPNAYKRLVMKPNIRSGNQKTPNIFEVANKNEMTAQKLTLINKNNDKSSPYYSKNIDSSYNPKFSLNKTSKGGNKTSIYSILKKGQTKGSQSTFSYLRRSNEPDCSPDRGDLSKDDKNANVNHFFGNLMTFIGPDHKITRAVEKQFRDYVKENNEIRSSRQKKLITQVNSIDVAKSQKNLVKKNEVYADNLTEPNDDGFDGEQNVLDENNYYDPEQETSSKVNVLEQIDKNFALKNEVESLKEQMSYPEHTNKGYRLQKQNENHEKYLKDFKKNNSSTGFYLNKKPGGAKIIQPMPKNVVIKSKQETPEEKAVLLDYEQQIMALLKTIQNLQDDNEKSKKETIKLKSENKKINEEFQAYISSTQKTNPRSKNNESILLIKELQSKKAELEVCETKLKNMENNSFIYEKEIQDKSEQIENFNIEVKDLQEKNLELQYSIEQALIKESEVHSNYKKDQDANVNIITSQTNNFASVNSDLRETKLELEELRQENKKDKEIILELKIQTSTRKDDAATLEVHKQDNMKANEKVCTLQREIVSQNQQLEGFRQETKKDKEIIFELNEHQKILKENIAILKENVAILEENKPSKNEGNEDVNAQFAKNDAEKEATGIDLYKEKIKELDTINKQLSYEFDEVNKMKKRLIEKEDKLLLEKEGDKSKHIENVKDLQFKVSTQEAFMKDYQYETNREIQDLNDTIKTKNEELEKLSSLNKNLEAEQLHKSELDAQVAELKSKIDTQKVELELTEKIHKTDLDKKMTENQNDQANEIKELKEKNFRLEKYIESEENKKSLDKTNKEKEVCNESKKSKVVDLRSELDYFRQETFKHENCSNSLKTALDLKENDLLQMEIDCEEKQEKINQLEEELSDAKEEVDRMQKKTSELDEQFTNKDFKIHQMTDINTRLVTENKKLSVENYNLLLLLQETGRKVEPHMYKENAEINPENDKNPESLKTESRKQITAEQMPSPIVKKVTPIMEIPDEKGKEECFGDDLEEFDKLDDFDSEGVIEDAFAMNNQKVESLKKIDTNNSNQNDPKPYSFGNSRQFSQNEKDSSPEQTNKRPTIGNTEIGNKPKNFDKNNLENQHVDDLDDYPIKYKDVKKDGKVKHYVDDYYELDF